MVVAGCRVQRRYRDDVPAVIFTHADNPEDTLVTVWACREVLEPEEGMVLSLPPSAETSDVESLLDAGYTVRFDRPQPPEVT